MLLAYCKPLLGYFSERDMMDEKPQARLNLPRYVLSLQNDIMFKQSVFFLNTSTFFSKCSAS